MIFLLAVPPDRAIRNINLLLDHLDVTDVTFDALHIHENTADPLKGHITETMSSLTERLPLYTKVAVTLKSNSEGTTEGKTEGKHISLSPAKRYHVCGVGALL